MARRLMRSILLAASVIALATPLAVGTGAEQQDVAVMRVPDSGIQPQAAMDSEGVLHVIYLKGDPGSADIYYVHKPQGAVNFSQPIRVNSTPGRAMAVGSVRGPQLAIGRNGRVHVAWMGAHPEGPDKVIPMLYTRLNDAGTAFEPERNVMQFAAGLDGGASVAADNFGNVYVVWHANPRNDGEAHRHVWVARSSDDGRTFAREIAADPPMDGKPTGACGCCGMRALTAADGTLYILYRAATDEIHRDMILLASEDHGGHFVADRVATWQLNACPMSTDFIAQTPSGILIAWEKAGQVFYAQIAHGSSTISQAVSPPGPAVDRKHPVVISNSRGQTLLAWTDGTAWQRGGSVAWQIFDKTGQPLDQGGSAPGLPVWDLVTASVGRTGRFTVLY